LLDLERARDAGFGVCEIEGAFASSARIPRAKPLVRRKAQRGCMSRGSGVKVCCRRPPACWFEETQTSLAAY
jgi:hypothetical protein